MRLIAAIACLAFALPALAEPVKLLRQRTDKDRPALMVVGSPHFGNPGEDVVNVSVPDVMSPARQAEVEAVVEALARFKPTHIAIEMTSRRQAVLDQRYADYRAGRYVLRSNEADQIGLRLAARLGHARVYAVDWNEMPPGQIADFDWSAYAEANGMTDRIAAMKASKDVAAQNRRMTQTSVGAWLRHANTPSNMAADHRNYFDYALLGDAENNPGAVWVGNWYARNLKVFANLVRLTDRPTDRVLVLYGASHAHPLTAYARDSGAFRIVDPLDYLPR